MSDPRLSIELILPAGDGERRAIAHTVGELEAHLGGRAYLWGWCTAMMESTRRGLSLSELDAFSTAERYGFVVTVATSERQEWRDKALGRNGVGQ